MNFKFLVYADRNNGRGMELSAWYNDLGKATKEAKFLRSKGYEVEIRLNK